MTVVDRASVPLCAYNSLFAAASGVSPFMASLSHQPPLFNYEEEEAAVPSVLPTFVVQENLVTGMPRPSLLLSPGAMGGELLQGPGTVLSSGLKSLALCEEPPASSNLEKAGSLERRPIRR